MSTTARMVMKIIGASLAFAAFVCLLIADQGYGSILSTYRREADEYRLGTCIIYAKWTCYEVP